MVAIPAVVVEVTDPSVRGFDRETSRVIHSSRTGERGQDGPLGIGEVLPEPLSAAAVLPAQEKSVHRSVLLEQPAENLVGGTQNRECQAEFVETSGETPVDPLAAMEANDRPMETEVRIDQGVRLATPNGPAERLDRGSDLVERLGGLVSIGLDCGQLQQPAASIEVDHPVAVDRRDHRAAVARLLYETSPDQHSDRFAKGVTGNLERGRQGGFSKGGSWHQLPGQDLPRERVDDLVGAVPRKLSRGGAG